PACGILRHVGDQAAARLLQALALQAQDVDAVDADPPAGDAKAVARQAQKGHAHGALAGAGLSDEAEDLSACHAERDVFDDRCSASLGDNGQTFHDKAAVVGSRVTAGVGHYLRESGHDVVNSNALTDAVSSPRSPPNATRASASAKTLVPTARMASRIAGASTPQ